MISIVEDEGWPGLGFPHYGGMVMVVRSEEEGPWSGLEWTRVRGDSKWEGGREERRGVGGGPRYLFLRETLPLNLTVRHLGQVRAVLDREAYATDTLRTDSLRTDHTNNWEHVLNLHSRLFVPQFLL